MSVENFICKECLCSKVCEVKKILLKFDEGNKNQLPANIEMKNCSSFEQVEE